MRVNRWLCGAVVALALAACAPAPAAPAQADPDLETLPVREPDTGAHYKRTEWGDWDVVGGCDARERALKAHGTDVRTGRGCKVLSGRWRSTYDGTDWTDPSKLDIDHVVPVHEAVLSGARNWTQEQRETFYSYDQNLSPQSASSNRSKGDQDPARWLPQEDRCGYLRTYVAVKAHFGLSVDQDEHDAIAAVLRRC